MDRGLLAYRNANLAEAIIVEFPEFVKNSLPPADREIYSYLPQTSRNLTAYFEPFIGSLVWRSPSSISRKTEKLLAIYFCQPSEHYRFDTCDALISVATKPKHPLHGERLFSNLARMSMKDCDLRWSEYVRSRSYDGSAVQRFVVWFESLPTQSISVDVAKNAVAVLSCFLTTTDHQLRDQATHALVVVGEKQPSALFNFVRDALRFKDPYVRERVIAAAYGVAMSKWVGSHGTAFAHLLENLATTLAKHLFHPSGDSHTHHALTRGYALGIIELAQRINPSAIPKSWKRYLKPPYKGIASLFPDPSRISPATIGKAKSAIHMDFGNYTIGRLVDDRGNYDAHHPIYKRVVRQILWRMANLGYSHAAFEKIDSEISSRSSSRNEEDAHKVDRYGKKYSWIAYFEMYGYRHAQNRLSSSRDDRPSDCDIDPSFPIKEPIAMPSLTSYIGSEGSTDSIAAWLENGPDPNYDALIEVSAISNVPGPWMLIDGSIAEEDANSGRQVWTSLNPYAMRPEDAGRFQAAVMRMPHLGNELEMPRGDYYTYTGEVGWSHSFGRDLRDSNGKLPVAGTLVFGVHQRHPGREKVKKAWYLLDLSLANACALPSKRKRQKRLTIQLQLELERVNSLVADDDRLSLSEVVRGVPKPRDMHCGFVEGFEWETIGGVRAETLSWPFNWESYHSVTNDYSGFDFPSPWVCEGIGLSSRNRSINLLDSKGNPASFYMREGNSWSDRIELLYLRKDLFNRYLDASRKMVTYLSWGERDVKRRGFGTETNDPALDAIYQSYKNVYKRVVEYTTAEGVVYEP